MPSSSSVAYGRTVREKAEQLFKVLQETGVIAKPTDPKEATLRNDAVRLLRHEDRIGLDLKEGGYYIKGQPLQPSASPPPPPRRSGIQRRTA